METRFFFRLLLILLLVGLVIAACSPTAPTATPSPPPPAQPSPVAKRGRCGDGICDDAEQKDPNLCPQDCAPTTVPPTDTPTPSPPTVAAPSDTPTPSPHAPAQPSPAAVGRCGDGICDDAEQKDPNLCPQDCPKATTPAVETVLPPATGMPDYEPPINVFLSLHVDADMDYETDTSKTTEGFYQRTHDEIDWLMAEAAGRGMHFTILFLGWYPKWALEQGDLSQFKALLSAGHEIGTHVHPLTYDPDQDLWIAWPEELKRYGGPAYDEALVYQAWDNAYRYVTAMLDGIGATEQNHVVGPWPFKCSDEGRLLAEFGFSVAAGDRSEKGTSYFGHMVWNPWRPASNDAPGHELEEDLNATFLSIDHYAQIGAFQVAHPVDLSVSQLQRRFLMLYAEWLSRERAGADDRVWVFGFVYHPNYTDKYNADLVEFLDWLDANFIGNTSPYGNVIAQYATVGEIAEQYYAWEAVHPGTSSFSYVRGDPYPYTYASIPTMLDGAAYEAHVDLGAGVTSFRFSRDGRPIYMLWSDLGERTVDFSVELSGRVRVTNAAGQESVQDAAALPLTEEPMFVQPLE